MFQEVGSESVLLSLAAERYFGLDRVGTRIWRLLEADSSLQSAYDTLLREFEVAPDTLERELLGLVEQLSDAGLVRIQ